MTPAIVQNLLTDTPETAKEVRTSDDEVMVVLNREQWIAAPDSLVILDRKGILHNITYWNITSIRQVPRNGREKRRKKRSGRR